MSTFLALAGGLGFVIGLRYRVPAAIAASALIAVVGAAVAYAVGASRLGIAAASVGAVTALQVGYLCGVVVVFLVRYGRAGIARSEP